MSKVFKKYDLINKAMIPITVYDRFAMGFSLGVHIIFATIGILVYTGLVHGNKDIDSSTVQCGAY